MASYTQIIRKQLINTNIDDLWSFMSSPKNLERITPDSMEFKITSNNEDQLMYPGMIISYKITPLLNFPLRWVTEITHVKEKEFFVDEQRLGPYRMWHHEHIFKIKEDGVLMTDIITYIPPFGLLGKLANNLFIKRRIKKIFDYRSQIIEQFFNPLNK
mgnify:FL=1